MKRILLVSLLVTLCFSDNILIKDGKYIYSYNKYLPFSRLNTNTGEVELYTDIHLGKFEGEKLKQWYQKYYSDMSYDKFLIKLKKKFPTLEFKYNGSYYWLKHNDYNKIKELPVRP